MRWREILLGAVSTLVASILAGVAIWYLTRDQPKSAELRYTAEEVVYFEGMPTQIAFVTVKVSNVGTYNAFDVRVVLTFPTGANLQEKQVVFSGGAAGTYKENQSASNQVDLSVALLAPEEVLSISALVKGGLEYIPTVSVRGRETVGSPGPFQVPSEFPGVSGPTSIFVTIGALIAQLLLIGILTRRFAMRLQTWISSVNNTAFLFIHKKMIDEAEELLRGKITTRGADLFLLSNFALVIGLQGDQEGAERHFVAAEWWQSGNAELALIKFNRSVLMIANGEYEVARGYLSEAFSLSRGQIKRYCQLSDYIDDATRADSGIRDLVTSSGR